MGILTQHANVAIRMYKNGIDLEFIKKFRISDINEALNRIEKYKIPISKYSDNELIQEELINDKEFIKYYNLAYNKKYDMKEFQELLKTIKNHGEKMSVYTFKSIFGVLDNKKLSSKAYYIFLKYFIDENFETRQNVTKNLNHFYEQPFTKIDNLNDAEKNLLKLKFLDNCNLIPKYSIKKVYELLIQNEELRNIIDFLYTKKLYIPLGSMEYEEINKNAKEIEKYIKGIINKINNDEINYQMLLRWKQNDCSIYDLKILKEKINNIELSELEKVFYNRTNYINFIYGNKLKKISLENISGNREEIIIYAIKENKKSFLNLIENNKDDFIAIPSNSILYYGNFYTKYINLNELTLKHLKKLALMECNVFLEIDNLKEQKYTFEEIETIYNLGEKYIKLYNELLDLKVDQRLLRIRQLSKKNLLSNGISDDDIKKLAEKIKIKPLYKWLELDFNKIKDIKIEHVIQILIHYEEIEKFVFEIKNYKELLWILRNSDKIVNYKNLQSIKDDIENIDKYWIKLKDEIKFSDDFLKKYNNNIKDFLLNNGAELAYIYYIERNEEQKKAFKLIIKAQLMGEFKRLKYHTDDLKKEIDYKLEDYQIKQWTENNSTIDEENYSVGEYDDFYHTMILGEYPRKTCLSYKSGGYNKCLLACFDSNKKILYAKNNDSIVARAMVRLTKGTFNITKHISKELSFIDVENGLQLNKIEPEEKLTLFLERPYISGISCNEEKKVKKLFIKLIKEKAKKMNALLVLSNYYDDVIDEQFITQRYYMYISKSKSSYQYLDSLSGQATVSDEGEYKDNYFLIEKIPKKNEKVNFQSIFAA